MRAFASVVAATVLLTNALLAQSRGTVQVRVVDSARAPIAGAEVAIVKGLTETLASGVTDSSGRRALTYDVGAGDVDVVARKIGFKRADRYVRGKAGDTISIEITLARVAQTLDAVKVTEREDVRRKSYFIDAEEIANSKRPIFDARDVIGKLRPDMVFGRPGSKVCPPALRVWVNGIRIRYARPNPYLMARRRMIRGTQRQPPAGVDALPTFVASILSDIKPEHIAEISYHDCMDSSLGRNGGESAIFIVLKPGIGFEQGVGTYLSEAGVIQSDGPELPDSLVFGAASMPSYRYRVLGVYDNSTGDPLEGVAVVDTVTNTKATTTSTGTVTLVFLPEGPNTVRLEKVGYVNLTFNLTISPRDTIPLTLVLEKRLPWRDSPLR